MTSQEGSPTPQETAHAKLEVARTLMMETGAWTNAAGYMTDAALWIDRAQSDLRSDGVSLLGDTGAPTGALSDLKPSIPQGESTAAGGWLPIESAPKDGQRILIYTPGSPKIGSPWRVREAWWATPYEAGFEHGWWQTMDHRVYHLGLVNDPTHWRPLPPPPAAGQDLSEDGAMTRDDWAKLVAKVLYSADDPDEGEYAVADAILSALSDASPASEHADVSRLPQDGSTPQSLPTLLDLEGVKEALRAIEHVHDWNSSSVQCVNRAEHLARMALIALQALEAKNV